MILHAVTLEDKYAAPAGPVVMNGTQALVRLTMLQAARDRAAGLDTAGYVTGYRGSPLGGVDTSFAAAHRFTAPLGIHVHPGVNEDLAATAIIGTQQVGLYGRARKEGVFALWYGKGPGVDRSGDVFHHGNSYGSSARGGVLVCAGDDHLAKSSTTAHQSEYALRAAHIPVLHPASLDEILDFGLIGWAMSRYTGLWVGMKLVTDLVDSSGVVTIDPDRPSLSPPGDFELPEGGLNIRAEFDPLEQERRLHLRKLPAALSFARANRVDRITLAAPQRRLGIVTTGKSWRDTRQALRDLGLDDERAASLGVSVYKVGMSWPLEPEGLAAFTAGHEELMVVEEKGPLIEEQVKALLYAAPADRRPRICGKGDAENARLLPSHGELAPADIARAIAARLAGWTDDSALLERFAHAGGVDAVALAALAPVRRLPFFCSGCPHNTSTRVPEGSRAIAGIGCHGMVQGMNRSTDVFVQMGGEGANWIGQAPFVETPHIFQNLGDGTYFHSGLLAIRAAVGAGVNITYKILFNDAVAMTGGQPVDGVLTPQLISAQVRAEGVKRIVVVADDVAKYRGQRGFAPDTEIRPRHDLDAVQRELRESRGVTVLIYDQMCATEKRRRRKRRLMVDPDVRVMINDLVCEACGDCSAKSNCLSVVPLETEFGTKRQIDQSTCNKDFSCIQGFCPSFVTAEGGRRPEAEMDLSAIEAVELPAPAMPSGEAAILVAGIGGTGVVTIGAILTMAAHLEGRAGAALDVTGLAQKGGQVTSHVRIADTPGSIAAVKLGDGACDVVIAADLVGSASKDVLLTLRRDHTRVILNIDEAVTGAFIADPDFRLPTAALRSIVAGRVGPSRIDEVAASTLAQRLLGDAIGANMMLVGFAWQAGLLPLSGDAILAAIELNGVAVRMNQAAFRLGRIAAAAPEALEGIAGRTDWEGRPHLRKSETVDELVARRVEFLTAYQDGAYADRYGRFVTEVARRERAAVGREGELTQAVALGLFRLMAYKDEYEVARLWTSPEARRQLAAFGAEKTKLTFHLAPPALARRDPVTGEPRKIRVGGWILPVFRVLRRLKVLRGSWADPFGHTAERRMERALIERYRELVDAASRDLGGAAYGRAVRIAAAAERIRGYGHIKTRNVEAVEQEWARLMVEGVEGVGVAA